MWDLDREDNMTNEEREAIAQLRAAFVHVWRAAGASLRIGAIGGGICALLTVCALCSALGSAVYGHPSPAPAAASGQVSRTAPAAPTATLSSSSPPTAATATPKPAPTATPKPASATVLKWSGNGEKSSGNFTVRGLWQISFTCHVQDIGYGTAPLYIYVYSADGSEIFGDEIDYECPDGHKGGGDVSIMHDGGGTFYLQVDSASCNWTITVQDTPD